MRRWLVLALCAFVAGIVLVLVLGATTSEDPTALVRSRGEGGDAVPTITHDPADPALVGRADGRSPTGDALETNEAPRIAAIGGSVRAEEDGTPIVGATVELVTYEHGLPQVPPGGSATTDEKGCFHLSAPRPPGYKPFLQARAPGRVARRIQVSWSPDPAGTAHIAREFRLPRGGRIEGRVVRTDGGPRGGVVLRPMEWSDTRTWKEAPPAFTREDGSFVLDHVPLDRSVIVVAHMDQAYGASLPLTLTAEAPVRRGVDVPVSSLGTVCGRLVLGDGSAWSDGSVWLEGLGMSSPGGRRSKCRVRGDGTFEISKVQRGTYALVHHTRQFADTAVLQMPVAVEGKTVDLGDLVVASGRAVSGRVVFEDGYNHAEDERDVYELVLALWQGSRARFAVVAEDGSFRFPAVGEGRWRLVVDRRTCRTEEELWVEAGTKDLVVDLVGPSAALRVRLLDSFVEEDDLSSCLTLLPHGVANSRTFVSASDWGAELKILRLAPGTYDLRLDVEGHALWSRDALTLGHGETVTLDAHLEPAPTLRRRVVTAAGRPVAGAEVILSTRSDYPGGPLNPRLHDEPVCEAETDENGDFEVEVPWPGLTITVKATGHATLRVPLADLPPGEVVLPRGWDVIGRLVGADDRSVGSARLLLDLPDHGSNLARYAKVAPDGTFRIGHVATGRYRLHVLSHGHDFIESVPFTVDAGPVDLGPIRVREH